MSQCLLWLDVVYHYVWGVPLLVLIMGVGIFLSIALKGLQFRELFYALRLAFGFEKRERVKGV